MISLLYVSSSLLEPDETDEQLWAIVDVAQARNKRQDITGALVFTGTDFVQILEGPEESVANVMASILIDPRHDQVNIVRREMIAKRSFPTWGMNVLDPDPAIEERVAEIRAARTENGLVQAVDAAIARMRMRYLPAEA